jgi:hypothetical protein
MMYGRVSPPPAAAADAPAVAVQAEFEMQTLKPDFQLYRRKG